MSLAEIFDKVQNDPDMKIDPTWIDTWLENIAKKEEIYNYLENKTTQSVQQEKHEILSKLPESEKWSKSLYMYRLVNDLQDLRLGSYIRWIRRMENGDWSLTNGGILLQIKFLKNGTYLVCKSGLKMMQYELDKCKTFQKMTAEEWIVLMANSSTGGSTSS
jgi:hypothetical protein